MPVFPQRKGLQLFYMAAEEPQGGMRLPPKINITEAKVMLQQVLDELNKLVEFYLNTSKLEIDEKTLKENEKLVRAQRSKLWRVKSHADKNLKLEELYKQVSKIEANDFQKIDDHILDAQKYKDDFEKYKLALHSFEATLRTIIEQIDGLLG